jgi:hypothetical protein
VVSDRAVTTNQGRVERAPYAAAIRSVERQERLEELLAHGTDVAGIIAACLRSPLHATRSGGRTLPRGAVIVTIRGAELHVHADRGIS